MNERKVTINMRRLYILSTIGGIALQIVSYHLWCIMWENPFLSSFGIHKITYSEAESYFTRKILIFIALLIIGVILHELIHGITWALFSPRHFKDIKFGIIWTSFMPYCHCKIPLHVNQYRIGAIAPLIILGIFPYILGLLLQNLTVFILGIFLILGAVGDIAILWNTRKIPANKTIQDHPTEPGFIVYDLLKFRK